MAAIFTEREIPGDPIRAAERLLDDYGRRIRQALEDNQLSEPDINHITASLRIDSGIYLSRNPRYKKSATSFRNFVKQLGLSEKLTEMFLKLAKNGLYAHQEKGICSILNNQHTIISTGTGSGKTETFLVPIFAHSLQSTKPGVKALIIYPMNSLAGDQIERIRKAVQNTHITFALYTGATPTNTASEEERKAAAVNEHISRKEIRANLPDILITNFVMLERMLMRQEDISIFVQSSQTLRYVVFDELHSYTGSKAAHIKFLLARLNHYLTSKPIYIGTSATLTSDDAGKAKLREFVNNLFDIESFELIEAEEEEEAVEEVKPYFPVTDAHLDAVDFAQNADTSIKILTGITVDTTELLSAAETIHTTASYKAIETSFVFNLIRDALREGACALHDLAAVVARNLTPEQRLAVNPLNLVRAFLTAIAYINAKAGEQGKPLLDYRTHVFIRNSGGFLQVCPHCGRYYSSELPSCEQDGFPLFSVYRGDTRYFVGKFTYQTLKPVLMREPNAPEQLVYVLIGHASDTTDDRFELRGNITRAGAFIPDDDGEYAFAYLNARNFDQVKPCLIELGDAKKDYLYLYALVTSLLTNYRKTLGFVDNRELASRYSTIFRDEFASAFLFEFLCLYYPSEHQLSIAKTLEYLQKKAAQIQASPLENEIFKELPIWFLREICQPERKGGRHGLVRLRDGVYDWDSLPELQRELLRIFIRERAINIGLEDDLSNSQYIRLQKHWAVKPYSIYFGDTGSSNRSDRGISLGEHAREYADFVQAWTVPAIQNAVDELVAVHILTETITSDGKLIYHLNPEFLCLAPPASPYGDGDEGYEDMKKRLLFTADVHSSDRKAKDREGIEAGFKRGDIHFVAATPTLEMGIDIGDLANVLMIGAPPSPANYAQRAGRAGRSSNHSALIVTFCSPNRPLDNLAFHYPTFFINGKITPPGFDPRSEAILKKHINAFALRNHIETRTTLRSFQANLATSYCEQIPNMEKAFGEWFSYEGYLDEFCEIVDRLLKDTDGKPISLIQQYGYRSGILPDYGFRQDQVIAVDIEKRDEFESKGVLDWQDYALTTRDVEQAFHFFLPGQTIYVGGEIYKTLQDGIYDILPDGTHQYHCFYAEKEELFAQSHKELMHYELSQYFSTPAVTFQERKEILEYGYTSNCLLSFRNSGLKKTKTEVVDLEKKVSLGYDLEREAFIFRFDSYVCDEILRNSLLAALVWGITERYRIGMAELRILPNVRQQNDADTRWLYSIIYDYDGNNNLGFKRIESDFDTLVRSAYRRLEACDCKTDGCYHCLRSYATQAYDSTLSKERALMFLGYLLGERRFEPAIEPYAPPQHHCDLVLTVRTKNQEAIVQSASGNTYQRSIEDDQNSALFEALSEAIYKEARPDIRALCIKTPLKWLADAIEKRRINKGAEAFGRFLFALQRFSRIEATHHP